MRAGAEPESLDEMWTRAWDRRGWPAGGRGAATVLALFAAQRMLTNRIDRALRPAGLTLARFEVLAVLAHADGRPVHVTGLADALQVHPTSVSSAAASSRLKRPPASVARASASRRARLFIPAARAAMASSGSSKSAQRGMASAPPPRNIGLSVRQPAPGACAA